MSKSNNTNIILIDKFGKMKTLQVNTKDFKKEDLYKKCGFKKDTDFSKQTEWKITVEKQKYKISVYAKTDGRANTENKYDFPPPIDNTLFFGSCIIINKNAEIPTSITSKEWDKIYDHLYGGFEDLGEEDSEEEESDDDVVKTKTGYAKDGFVVDDDVVDEEDDESSEEVSDDNNEDDEIPRTKKLKNTKPTKIILKKKPQSKTTKQSETFTIFGKIIGKAAVASKKSTENLTSQDENTLECTSELSEESYIE